MFQFVTEDYAGFPAQTLNWIALGLSILIALLILMLIIKLFRGSRLGSGRRGRHARLAVTDAASIGDDRRKLVLVRRDNVEHLLLIGGSNDLVIESDIVRTAPQQTAARTPLATPAATAPAPAASPSPVSNVPQPAATPVQPAPTKPAEAPAAAVPAPTPAAAPIVTPAPAAPPTPAAAPIVTPAPAPTTSTAPVTVAAATATAAAIASTTPAEPTAATVEETTEDTEPDTIEIWDNSSVESASELSPVIDHEIDNEIKIESPATASVVTPAAQPETVIPMNSVEEMDALLNEITTEK